jgi:Lrp/AsnC family leucine-responsive transcriptional regulator
MRGYLGKKCAQDAPQRYFVHNTRMNALDSQILAQLQVDASLSHAQIGERVHLSASQVSRRIQRMEEDGVIRGHVALLDHEALGLQVEAYVTVKLASYARADVEAFHRRVTSLPSVVECCSLTGDSDYLLRVVSHDLKAFNALINRDLLDHGDVANVRSSIVLDRIKRTTALPLKSGG